MNELQTAAKGMSVINVCGRSHVIRRLAEQVLKHRAKIPDYEHTRQALVGVLIEGQTFENFKETWIKNRKGWDKNFTDPPSSYRVYGRK